MFSEEVELSLFKNTKGSITLDNTVYYKLCSKIGRTNFMCRQLNEFQIYVLKPQYFKEQRGLLAKFP